MYKINKIAICAGVCAAFTFTVCASNKKSDKIIVALEYTSKQAKDCKKVPNKNPFNLSKEKLRIQKVQKKAKKGNFDAMYEMGTWSV